MCAPQVHHRHERLARIVRCSLTCGRYEIDIRADGCLPGLCVSAEGRAPHARASGGPSSRRVRWAEPSPAGRGRSPGLTGNPSAGLAEGGGSRFGDKLHVGSHDLGMSLISVQLRWQVIAEQPGPQLADGAAAGVYCWRPPELPAGREASAPGGTGAFGCGPGIARLHVDLPAWRSVRVLLAYLVENVFIQLIQRDPA